VNDSIDTDALGYVEALAAFLDACPSPSHVVAAAEATLVSNGFTAGSYTETDQGIFGVSKGALHRDGALIAWNWPEHSSVSDGALIVGAHTDSPCLRRKPHQGAAAFGFAQLEVEIYGGVLLNSWLDRDLGLGGTVHTASGETVLFTSYEAVARVPQLAIHLDRDVNEKGVVLHRQMHMRPIWGSASGQFLDWLAEQSNLDSRDIVGHDLRLFDAQPAALIGHDQRFLASGRLDNQVSCWAALSAMIDVTPSRPFVIALFDHEEVGSESTTGAGGPMLEVVLDELLRARGLLDSRFDFHRKSLCVSADNAHAVHPNYSDRHDALHAPVVNSGPALKVNANQRYATSPQTYARIKRIAALENIPLQTFVSNNAMPCGSTIGPITATRLGIDTVDLGVPQLSMHSARELCGVDDPWHLVRLIESMARN